MVEAKKDQLYNLLRIREEDLPVENVAGGGAGSLQAPWRTGMSWIV